MGYANTNNAALIGMGWDAPPVTTYKFAGSIDEAALYSRALTTTEINRAYNDGLGRVALWRMDNDWTDAPGHGNHGTAYNGATFSPDKRVGSYAGSFDGTDDYVSGKRADFPSGSSPADPIRVGKARKRNAGQDDIAIWNCKQHQPTGNFRLYIDSSNRAAIGNGDGYGVVGGTSFLADGNWHFVTGIYGGPDTNIARIYVDGILENSGAITTPGTTSEAFSSAPPSRAAAISTVSSTRHLFTTAHSQSTK